MALAVAPVETPDALTPQEHRHLVALEKRIERGLVTFREVGMALLDIRDQRLFRMTHKSFEAYCRERWDLERNRAYQLMGAAEVANALGDDSGIVNEAQARELVPVYHSDPKLVKQVMETARAGGKPISAPMLREAVRAVAGTIIGKGGNGNGNGGAQATPVTPTARLLQSIRRLGQEYEGWAQTHPSAAEKRQVTTAIKEFVASTK